MIALVRAIGWLAILVIAGALTMGVIGRGRLAPVQPDKTGGFRDPVLALEFVETTGQATAILDQPPGQNREVVRILIWIDFAWIVCYALLFFCLSYLLARRKSPWATYLGWLGAICGGGAALFDVWENIGMLAVVKDPVISQATLSALHIRDTALTKWILVFVTMTLLALPLKGLTKQLDRVSLLFTLTAAAGLIGILYKPYLGLLILLPMLAGLITLAYYSLRAPTSFLETDRN